MANAVHISKKTKNGGSKHAVGFGDLRVVLLSDAPGVWYAQGLEIDYIAQGQTLEGAKKAFESGLVSTINEHLKLYGNIRGLLQVAPPEKWAEAFDQGPSGNYRYSQVSNHKLSQAFEDAFLVATTTKKKPRTARSKKKGKPTSRTQTAFPFDRITYLKCA